VVDGIGGRTVGLWKACVRDGKPEETATLLEKKFRGGRPGGGVLFNLAGGRESGQSYTSWVCRGIYRGGA